MTEIKTNDMDHKNYRPSPQIYLESFVKGLQEKSNYEFKEQIPQFLKATCGSIILETSRILDEEGYRMRKTDSPVPESSEAKISEMQSCMDEIEKGIKSLSRLKELAWQLKWQASKNKIEMMRNIAKKRE